MVGARFLNPAVVTRDKAGALGRPAVGLVPLRLGRHEIAGRAVELVGPRDVTLLGVEETGLRDGRV
jgi:hypothetical protein